MKSVRRPLLCLLCFSSLSLLAEEAILKQSTILKAERTIMSLKPGTIVDVISREGGKVTIKYKNVTGVVPADKFEEGKAVAETKPEEPKAKEAPPAETPAPRPPQTTYGKAVDKAKDAVKKHDQNQVRPASEMLN